MCDPVVSVVMGVYNGSAFLEETIKSVQEQTFQRWEFIIIDDGSKDDSVRKILARIENEDHRVRVVVKENEGLTKSLIFGCQLARGRYIARIDNGDTMLPERLQKQVDVLESESSVVCVSCATEVCGPSWEHLYGERDQDDSQDVVVVDSEERPISGISHHGSVMFRYDAYIAVGGYRSEFYYSQDMDLWYRLSEKGRFFTLPDCLYRVRIFPDSISGQNRLRQEKIGGLALKAYWCRRKGESELACLQEAASIRPDMKHRCHKGARGEGPHFIAELLRQRRNTRCRHYFLKALRENPFRIQTWFRLVQSIFMRQS